MPSALPFTPSSVSPVRQQPKRQHTSDFTGFVQQVRTLAPYWSGTLDFAPSRNQSDINRWQAWAAEQARSDDPSFWVPLQDWSHTGDRTTFDAARPATRQITITGVAERPDVGALVEIYSENHPNISVVRIITADDGTNYTIDDDLPLGMPTPLKAILTQPRVRAIAVNEDVMGARISPANFRTFSTINWQEALGHIIREIEDA